ncbi:MAG: DUF167 domain-containing protein [Candidatus Peregrinibacteria bacterium]|nr:DUF167 domain-containing protein [Candidatus Peregrinibacteria bacterium]
MDVDALRGRLANDGSVTLSVRARPGAHETRFKGEMSDGSIKIDIASSPEDGRANDELLRFLAEQFDVSRRDVVLLSGATARLKLIRITGKS